MLLKVVVSVTVCLSLLVVSARCKNLPEEESDVKLSETSEQTKELALDEDTTKPSSEVEGASLNESLPVVRYDGTQLWRIPIRYTDKQERETVSELLNKYETKTWMASEGIIDVLIKQEKIEGASKLLENSNLTHVVLIEDLQKAIDSENPPKEEIEMFQNRKGHRMTWKAYHRLADIHSYLDYLAKAYPDICSVHTIGHSHQNKALKLIKISNRNSHNRKIWIDGGIHAREWISPATVTYTIDQLVENWDDLPPYMRSIDWYILPVLNPDGYEYTHQYDRLWRKNRRSGGSCIGADLNRNFGHKWGGQGVSKNPCVETFGGSKAFSEPETLAVKNFFSKYSPGTFKAYMTFHSYGQYILYPWGFDKTVPTDYKDLDRVGREAAANMLRIGGARYQVGSSGSLLYPAAGGSDDWAKAVMGIKYSYTVEMRDTGRYGFILPANQIEITSKEGWAFISTVAKAAVHG